MLIQDIELNKLKFAEYNPRSISKEEFNGLKISIKTFNFVEPIVVNKDLTIIGGHQRARVAIDLGIKTIPCNVVDLDKKQEKKLNLVLNSHAISGKYDDLLLSELLEELKLDDQYFELRLDKLEPLDLSQAQAEEDEYVIPDEIKTDIVIGDLFEIGEHRLLCGDSTNVDTVAKLMNGEKADICVCDPPYGISVVGKNSRMKKLGWEQYANDNNIETAVNSFNIAFTICDKLVFWGANHYANKLPNVGGWLVWDKQDGKDSLTYSMGELAWTNTLTNVQIFTHVWDGFRKDSEKREPRMHPSQKPVKLHEWTLKKIKSTLVLDLFLGSGSGMVASHQLKKKCYGMELDPKYCQVIVDRMKKLEPSIVIKKNGKDI